MSHPSTGETWKPLLPSYDWSTYGQLCCGIQPTGTPTWRPSERLATAWKTQSAQQPYASCCESGLWLLLGELDQSHELSQSVSQPEGSYWHGIMHRLEGDFWNSKYWFRKVGKHPVLEQLRKEFPGYPDAFVDLSEQAFSLSSINNQVAAIGQREWQLLFDFCWDRATRG